MKAGKLAIQPWPSYRYTKNTLMDELCFSYKSHSSLNMYYETQVPSLTCISLHVVLTNFVNTNFA